MTAALKRVTSEGLRTRSRYFQQVLYSTVDRIPLLLVLVIGLLLNPGSATAQRSDKTTARTGKNATISKTARTSHTTSTKSSSKTSKAAAKTTSPSVATSAVITDESAKALEAIEVERVRGLEQERIQADIKKDKRWFEDCLAEDLTSATSEGRLENKAQLIARRLNPTNIVESEKYDELSVRAYGDVIIATGTLSQTGKDNNVPYNIQGRFTDVWVNRGGMWQQVAMHVSPIGAGNVANQSATPAASPPQSTKAGAASELQSPAATQTPQLTPRPTAPASPTP
jgi:ketosteroid isomerase-like protein